VGGPDWRGEWWADEELRDIGRLRFHKATSTTASADTASPGTIDRISSVFVAHRHPWRLSEVALAAVNDEVTPAVASWADEAAAVLKGTRLSSTLSGRTSHGATLGSGGCLTRPC